MNPIIISANKNIAEAFSGAICHTTVWKQLMKFRYKTNINLYRFLFQKINIGIMMA